MLLGKSLPVTDAIAKPSASRKASAIDTKFFPRDFHALTSFSKFFKAPNLINHV